MYAHVSECMEMEHGSGSMEAVSLTAGAVL